MKILTIIGTAHKENTRAIVDLFLKEFENENNEFEEIILPKDFQNFCQGCANCILKGEEKCPHFNEIAKIVEKIENADLIIMATPVFVGSCTSGLKALLDHLAYMWLVHRPKESMFHKVGLIITSAGGSGVKQTVKLLKSNFFFWGVPKVYDYGVTTMKKGGLMAKSRINEDYYQYVKENPIVNWNKDTHILYGNKDNIQEQNIIKDFSNKFNCELSILENGEHYFHTEEQLDYYKNWLDRIIK